MVVGLTGRYCAGKDTVARFFAARGFLVIDGDALGHEVLAKKAAEVTALFGPSVRRVDGTVDRRALGRRVFGDPAALRQLEIILHPAMAERARRIIAGARGDVLINAAVLQRMGLSETCDAVLFVTAPPAVRLWRSLRRDRMPLRDALARIGSQRDVRPQLNGRAVDTYTVRNWGTTRSLERRLEAIVRRMKGGEV
jgi:dephospho-CoA kinase